ncbi:DUF998 domain-containing protein [Microbacterium sp.]|uniref:DUF998 domain-containing protein n=1 Tax=Microbacterium sp. TaxID=51671 RepID=UPI00333F272C
MSSETTADAGTGTAAVPTAVPNAAVTRILTELRMLRESPTREAVLETAALLVGALFFVIGFVVALLSFWGHVLPITGPGSIGVFASVSGAVTAAASFVLGRLSVRPDGAPEMRDGFVEPGQRLRWYDLIAIGFAHAAIALLGWIGIAQLLELSFQDAPVYAFPGGVLIGVALALTAYVCYLSAAALDPMNLSLVLAIFLVVGAFAAMLAATDKHWWRDNLSALGQTTNGSAPAFNATIIAAGVMVTTIARYATAALPTGTREERRGRGIVRAGLILLGIFLACVGIFPVDAFFLLHNTVATGMAAVFAVVVVGLPWFLRDLPRAFIWLGWIYVLVIALLGIFFATGYYNLTAVELIAAVLIFSWIIVFLRTASVAHAAGRGPQPAAS